MTQAQVDKELGAHIDGGAGDPLLAVVEDSALLAADILRRLQIGQQARHGPLINAGILGQAALAVHAVLAILVVAKDHGRQVQASQQRASDARKGVPFLLIGAISGAADTVQPAQPFGLAALGLLLNALLGLAQQAVENEFLFVGEASQAARLLRAVDGADRLAALDRARGNVGKPIELGATDRAGENWTHRRELHTLTRRH
ncbi:hypothetical protein D3C80_1189670 [compost metagenome]